FDKYGKYMLFICYFIPGVRHVAAYIAGITYFSFKRFAIYAYSGAFVWVLTFLILGNRLGRNWHVIFTFVKEDVWILAALGVMAVISLGFYFLFFRRRRHKIHIPIRSLKATVESVSIVSLTDGCFSFNTMTVDQNVKLPI